MGIAGIQRMFTREKPPEGIETDSLPGFETLLRRYQSMVFSIACHYLGESGRAEEVAQDVFLQLHADLGRIESEEHAVAWLRRVTAHRSIDALRSPAVSRAVELDAIAEPESRETNDDILLQQALRRMVATLPEKQRIVIVLRYQEDLDPMEIADLLGMPLATVKSHLRRALELLRQKARWLGSPARESVPATESNPETKRT